jgi:hypothetical protein
MVKNATRGIVHRWIEEDELLKLHKNGQFPDETVGMKVE